MPARDPIADMVERLLAGDRRAAARVISWLEAEREECREILRRIYPHTGRSMILGITGAGGSGKSTLINHLISAFRGRGKSVGAVLVDPSSPFSGGAFLGDRIRMKTHAQDPGVFIRSLAARGYLGGLARATYDVIRVMEAAGMDVVLVETLGAGQDEIDIIHIAQTCLLVVTPGMGDDIQTLKAGIMEIADIIVLNKADLDGANNCLRHLEATLSDAAGDDLKWVPRVIPTVSMAAKPEDIQGIAELVSAIEEHQGFLAKSRTIDQVRFERAEHELGLIFQDEVQRLVFDGLRGSGKKKEYIRAILAGNLDPYTVVDEVLNQFVGTSHGKDSD